MLNIKLSNLIKSVKIVQPFLKKKKSLVQLCVCGGGGGFFKFAHLKPTFSILHSNFYKTRTSVCNNHFIFFFYYYFNILPGQSHFLSFLF